MTWADWFQLIGAVFIIGGVAWGLIEWRATKRKNGRHNSGRK